MHNYHCNSLAGSRNSFGVGAQAIRDLGLRDAEDAEIFQAARKSRAVIISKDSDFVDLVLHHGPPPQELWVTCGNLSNLHLHGVFKKTLPDAVALLKAGESIVEIGDPDGPEESVLVQRQ